MTKNNCVTSIRHRYPTIEVTTVFNRPYVIIDKPVDEYDARRWFMQSLTAGKYVLFPTADNADMALEMMQHMNDAVSHADRHPASYRVFRHYAPTTYTAFKTWVEQYNAKAAEDKKIVVNACVHLAYASASDVFQDDALSHEKRGYYQFEIVVPKELTSRFCNCICVETTSTGETRTIAILIKAPTYVSRRHRAENKYVIMVPIEQQIITALAHDDESKTIQLLCTYLSTTYERIITISEDIVPKVIEGLKQHVSTGALHVYLISQELLKLCDTTNKDPFEEGEEDNHERVD